MLQNASYMFFLKRSKEAKPRIFSDSITTVSKSLDHKWNTHAVRVKNWTGTGKHRQAYLQQVGSLEYRFFVLWSSWKIHEVE